MSMSRRGFVAAAVTGSAAALLAPGASARALTSPIALSTGRRLSAASDPARWMAALADGTPLTRLTIPGTHDTCATDPMNGTEWSHTQNMGIPEQLRRGIRFFDIRCGEPPSDVPDELGIYHASYYQDITFNTVLDQCRDFLRASPGETVLMRVKNEHGLTDAQLSAKFGEYLGAKGYGDLFLIEPDLPALGAARGKVVLITQFASGLGAPAWPAGDNGTFSNEWFELQDHYATSVDTKRQDILRHFDTAAAHQDSGRLFLNFTSLAPDAANGFRWPKHLADAVMPTVLDYLDGHPQPGVHLGVVVMDFPEFHAPATESLIARNFPAATSS
ncbi:phosphatidylinositol-specific phospholipase C [Streptomyces ochraceiscleroticus]|uniref:1-phosphatidylinositol phosphodiesterase n=1 Tax=Streptomyces ochraceiscleroticus TaxID=47761 RepID=A0ABW1MN29_9ACTN|nr:phosphatidylinositol-specific phospholipase C [Streptomyces ochraceiscleroticus]